MSDVVGLVVAFGIVPAFFAAVDVVDVLMSGWYEIARRFPDRSPMPRARAGTYLRFGRYFVHRYQAVVGVDEAGLHVRLPLIGRFSHRPLLFPWSTKPWDIYGVGYYTAIAIPQRSRAAALLRDYVTNRPAVEHR
jgi:hypothetical protein